MLRQATWWVIVPQTRTSRHPWETWPHQLSHQLVWQADLKDKKRRRRQRKIIRFTVPSKNKKCRPKQSKTWDEASSLMAVRILVQMYDQIDRPRNNKTLQTRADKIKGSRTLRWVRASQTRVRALNVEKIQAESPSWTQVNTLVNYVRTRWNKSTTRSRIKIKSKSSRIGLLRKFFPSILLYLLPQAVEGMLKRLEKRRSKWKRRMKSLSDNKRSLSQGHHWPLNKRYKGRWSLKARRKLFGRCTKVIMVKHQTKPI